MQGVGCVRSRAKDLDWDAGGESISKVEGGLAVGLGRRTKRCMAAQ